MRARAKLVLVARSGLPPRDRVGHPPRRARQRADRPGRPRHRGDPADGGGRRAGAGLAADVTDPDDLRRVRDAGARGVRRPGRHRARGRPARRRHGRGQGAGRGGAGARAEARRHARAGRRCSATTSWTSWCCARRSPRWPAGSARSTTARRTTSSTRTRAARNGWRAPVLSQNWGGWAEVGMAAETAAPAAFRALTHDGATRSLDHPVLTTVVETAEHTVAARAGVGRHPLAARRAPDRRRAGGAGHRTPGVRAGPPTAAILPGPAGRRGRAAGRGVPRAVRGAGRHARPVPGRDVHCGRSRGRPGAGDPERRGGRRPAPTCAARPAGPTDAPGAGPGRQRDHRPLPAGRRRRLVRPRPDQHADVRPALGSRCAEHHLGDGEELARIVAPPATSRAGACSPALLDVATAFGRGRGEGTYLPLSYGRIVVRGPLPTEFYSHLTYRDGDDRRRGRRRPAARATRTAASWSRSATSCCARWTRTR